MLRDGAHFLVNLMKHISYCYQKDVKELIVLLDVDVVEDEEWGRWALGPGAKPHFATNKNHKTPRIFCVTKSTAKTLIF